MLQYLGPVFVTVYIAIKAKKAPTPTQLLSVLLALLGTFFLVTAGNFHVLAISGMAIFWGFASALALAFYTIQPVQLLKEWGSGLTEGWGMLIGGVAFSFFSHLGSMKEK